MLLVNAIDRMSLELLLDRYGLQLHLVSPEEVIPGSYWGEREAGLIGAKIFARLDTPVHSVLHESAHFICMTPERRAGLDTDAGGDDAEESAVCYLQVVLADGRRLTAPRLVVAAAGRQGANVPRYGRLGLQLQTGKRRDLVCRGRTGCARLVDSSRLAR